MNAKLMLTYSNRVNMYASTWICTKVKDVDTGRKASTQLADLSLGMKIGRAHV